MGKDFGSDCFGVETKENLRTVRITDRSQNHTDNDNELERKRVEREIKRGEEKRIVSG